MALLVQVLGVLVAGGLLYALVERLGTRIQAVQAVALAVVVFLTIAGIGGLREGFRHLSEQRETNAEASAESARATCFAVGVNDRFLIWAAGRIPVRARYALFSTPQLRHSGDICIRFLLLPRLQVPKLAEARYALFFGDMPASALAEVRRRGGTIETFEPGHAVARMPR